MDSSRREFLKVSAAGLAGVAAASAAEPVLGMIFPPANYEVPPEAKLMYPTGIRFLAKGCVPAMACASAVTELVQGKTLEEARQLRSEDLVQTIGSLPEASAHASQLAMEALHANIAAKNKVESFFMVD